MPKSFLVKKSKYGTDETKNAKTFRNNFEDNRSDVSIQAAYPVNVDDSQSPIFIQLNNGYMQSVPAAIEFLQKEDLIGEGESMNSPESSKTADYSCLPSPILLESNSQYQPKHYGGFIVVDGRTKHRENDMPRHRFRCDECGKDYATSSNLSRHKQTHRSLDSQLAKKCPHCEKVYVSMPALSMHILTHSQRHICNICGKSFSRPWLLRGHIRSHSGQKPFGCSHCGKAFADRSNLRAHMNTHSAFKQFQCQFCKKTFALKSYLNKHHESMCLKYPFQSSQNHDKWMVVTSVSAPSSDIYYLANITGWKLVVVGDKITPSNWSQVNCLFLSYHDQQFSPFRIKKLLPNGSYSRKTLGYLYAIANGAQVIYETDDNNRPTDKLQNFNLKSEEFGMRYRGQNLFNPYSHFGQSSIWPKGFPLEKISDQKTLRYDIGKFTTPYIQQGLVNGDPDVDAIFRLTRKSKSEDLNVSFDEVAPPVIVPSGVLSPFNSRNTLYVYDAFWAMVLPISTSCRSSDIWKNYWAQRLLWEIGGTVGFYRPNAFHKRNPHAHVNEANKESALYFRTEELTQYLLNWRCNVQLTFFKCVRKLAEQMMLNKFWTKQDVHVVKVWLEDLIYVGYIEPSRIPYISPASYANTTRGQWTRAVYKPTEQKYPQLQTRTQSGMLQSKWDQVLGITSFCNLTSYQITTQSFTSITYPNILLIIVFNFPIYDNIPHLQLIYGVTFSHIVYCGNSMEAYAKSSSKLGYSVTFLEVDVNRGYYAEKCLSEAMKMNHNVKGYLLIGDDTLLNSWNIPRLPLDKIWFQHKELLLRDKPHLWHWWNGAMGRPAFNKAWEEFLLLSLNDSSKEKVINSFMNQLEKSTHSKFGLYHGPSDIVFIPIRFKPQVIFFMDMFSKHNVFMEIVIPTVLFGLDDSKNIVILPGQYLWYDGKREHVPEIFRPNEVFLHPVKFSAITSSLKTFFCNTFSPYILGGVNMTRPSNRTVHKV